MKEKDKITSLDLKIAWLIVGAAISLGSAIYFLNEMVKVGI